ncbi:MAG TPA: AI-2E family transporter [Ktedonobacteraceae bacterium]
MSSPPDLSSTSPFNAPFYAIWLRRFLFALTILAWIAIGGVILYVLGRIIDPIFLLIISLLIAYILYPLVKIFQRFMPRPLAILVVFLLLVVSLAFIIFYVMFTAITQLYQVAQVIEKFIVDVQKGHYPDLVNLMNNIGVTKFLQSSAQQLLGQVGSIAASVIPFVSSIFAVFINIIIVASFSVYLLADGPRVIYWLKHKTPLKQHERIDFMLSTLEQTVGGFVRGQLLLSALMSFLIGVGAYFIGIPFAVLIAVMVFILEFVPVVGAYISGAIGILFALTQGWQVALIYAIFVTFMQGILDGQILAPRILGRSVGIHPIISIFALIAMAQLFGLFGALLAVPLAACAQIYIVTFWKEWKARHPEEFPPDEKDPTPAKVPEQSTAKT